MNPVMSNLGGRLARYLSRPNPRYKPLATTDLHAIAEAIEPGDVLLVEGNTRFSTAIKYLSQSTWSHAALYVGNDVGSTYVAAATGCPTLAIYGPTDPAVSAPYMVNGRVVTLWQPYDGDFIWAKGTTVEMATAAAEALLMPQTSAPA